ncbi:MAG: hypothetical protein K0R38_7856, partial [Polyangiaceae bacterium]|nr:hypothetical protein [Polyangiaceae bacterium]
MVGKKTFGALGVFSFWSQLALAQAPVDSSAPAPEVPPVPNPATEAAPAPPVSAPPSAEAVPPQAAPSPPAAETEAPTATPRVRWKDTDATQAAPQEGSEEAPDESTPPPPPEGDAWQLGGAHFVLSLERLTTVLAWKQTTTLSTPSGGGFNSPATTSDATTSGTDISFLFGGGERTPSSLPRIAFDGIFNGGFTIGGSVGLMSSTAKSESNAFRGESAQADLTGALFGVRAGYFGVAGSVGI